MAFVDQVSTPQRKRTNKLDMERAIKPFREAVEAVETLKERPAKGDTETGFNYLSGDDKEPIGFCGIAEVEGDFRDLTRDLTLPLQPVLDGIDGIYRSMRGTAEERSMALAALKVAKQQLVDQLNYFGESAEDGKMKLTYHKDSYNSKPKTGNWPRFTLKYIDEHNELSEVVVATEEHAPFLRSAIKEARDMAKAIDRSFSGIEKMVNEANAARGRS